MGCDQMDCNGKQNKRDTKNKKTYNKMNELTIGSIPFGLVQNTILHLEVNLIPNKYIPLLWLSICLGSLLEAQSNLMTGKLLNKIKFRKWFFHFD